jgi:hypothetical protein
MAGPYKAAGGTAGHALVTFDQRMVGRRETLSWVQAPASAAAVITAIVTTHR